MNEIEIIGKRFQELDKKRLSITPFQDKYGARHVKSLDWQAWATSVMDLLQRALGKKSDHYECFTEIYDKDNGGGNFRGHVPIATTFDPQSSSFELKS